MHETEKSIVNVETQRDTPAVPRRYWWLRRIAVGYTLFVGMVGGLYWVSSSRAERLLGAELDRLRVRGEPATLGDLAGPPIPEEQNAAILLKRVGELDLEDADALGDISLQPPLSAGDAATLERILGKWEAGLRLVRRARDLPGVNWGLTINNPGDILATPHLLQISLHERVAAAAALAHAKQNDCDAVEYLRDLLMLSRVTDQPSLLIPHLQAMGMRGQTIRLIDAMVPQLRITRQEAARSEPPGAANPSQVRSLIRDLVDDDDFHQGLTRAMQGERVWNMAAFPEWWGNEWWKTWPTRPLLLTEARASLSWSSQYIEAARERNLPAAQAKLPPSPPASLRPNLKLAAITAPGHAKTLLPHYRNLAAGRATAIALAHRLYQFDHGRPAMQWGDLVPRYLPAIPADPLTGKAAMPFTPTTQPAGGK